MFLFQFQVTIQVVRFFVSFEQKETFLRMAFDEASMAQGLLSHAPP